MDEMRAGLPPFLLGVRNDWTIEPLAQGGSRLTGAFADEFKAFVERS